MTEQLNFRYVHPSVCPSVTRVLCDKFKEPTVDIFLYHMKGQSFYFSDAKDVGEIPTGHPRRGRQIEVG